MPHDERARTRPTEGSPVGPTRSPDPAWTRRRFVGAAGAAGALGLAGLVGLGSPLATASPRAATDAPQSRAEVVATLRHRRPRHFGMFLDHVVTRGRRRTALTFDACGGPRGSHYDEKLVGILRRHAVPATLFLNARWIATFPGPAAELAADPLFELANHGSAHRPLTVRGQSAYGIRGTRSVGEAYDEIVSGLDALGELTGARSPWFRPGTAWADDVGVEVARRLGVQVVSFGINVDLGATASTTVVARNLSGARSRSITLGHVNHPEGKTAEGLAKALPGLLDRGRRFVTLSQALA